MSYVCLGARHCLVCPLRDTRTDDVTPPSSDICGLHCLNGDAAHERRRDQPIVRRAGAMPSWYSWTRRAQPCAAP